MKAWVFGAGIGVALGVSAIAWSLGSEDSDEQFETYRKLDLFARVLHRVETDYVTDVDKAEAIDAAINGMLASLDPHSSYLDADAFSDMQVQTSGEYGGLGLEVTMEDGLVRVVAPIDDTPGSRAGLKSGDLLTAIDGKPIFGGSLNESVDKMRGEVGTDITLTVLRKGEEPFDVTITREVIRPPSVTYSVKESVGYMRISTFNERTYEGLNEAVKEFSAMPRTDLKGVIIDVRNNPGGILEQAIDVSGAFLDGGEVVSTRGRDTKDIKRYNAKRGDRLKGVPLAVLINGGSASAAEIVAGALQDRKRATIIGMTSFGKGSVQTITPLGADLGAIRLTTARYYTPSGKSIQATGIEPDVAISAVRFDPEEDQPGRRYSEADLPNSLDNESGDERDSEEKRMIEMPPEDYEGEDYQLDRAIEILNKIEISALPNIQAG